MYEAAKELVIMIIVSRSNSFLGLHFLTIVDKVGLGASLDMLNNGAGGTLSLSPPSPVPIMFTMLFIRERLGNVAHLRNITILKVVITVEMVTPENEVFVGNVMQIKGYTNLISKPFQRKSHLQTEKL